MISLKEKIITRLIKNIDLADHTLLHGKPGILLALSYYFCYESDLKEKLIIKEKIEYCIDKLFDHIENDTMDGSLAFGVTGISFALQISLDLLNQKEENDIELFDQLNLMICNSMEKSINIKDYDLLRGATGHVLYLMNYSSNYIYIEKYIDSLYNDAVWIENNMCYWIFYSFNNSKEKLEYRDDIINLGLAHGIAGIISVLSDLYKKDFKQEKCSILINGAINYLKSVEIFDQKSQFCGIVYKNEKQQNSSRLGWCYGDSSLGLAILKAGIYLENENWIDYGNKICLKSSERTIENSDLDEHGICHGYLGTMHIYNRLFMTTKNAIYLNRKEYWYNAGMNNRDFKIDNLGFYQADLESDGSLNKYTTSGLLQGLSGIYLCIASYKEIKYPWDKIFLLNI